MTALPRALASALAVALLLGGCSLGERQASSSPPGPAGGGGGPSASGSPGTTDKPAVPPAPKQPACYRLALDELVRSANASRPVPCRSRHNAVTIFVGRLHAEHGQKVAVGSRAAQQQLARRCPRKLSRFVGGGPVTRHLSRFNAVWFRPSPAEADRGARWFRCDLVAFAAPDRLFQLPRPRRLHGVLDRTGAPGAFGLCGTAAPGAAGFERVICARRHSWRAITTIRISDRRHYPGVGTVRQAGDAACRQRVQAMQGFTLRFSYGWEWPTRAQWTRGQHFGYCWARD